ncbi:diacylglycerol/lipid kinase family protein [Mucilaginibacter sp. X5P1]|uniref:diacylglycerol/lipid kinase family protein n=1 Tax=Mucilaginibacter sp. X5P1 TaxID=2723088 RepID=UPI0016130EB3|nr:diacylglycerol kinase family protein [Mucilaginibacter sp. X5P1]MBB6139050.1 YegS/Rv2252/BmrU family lipid kinase [Mucilaginibacter sp. X5P1]
MKRKALFIINPVSGGKKKDGVPDMIDKNLDKSVFEYSIVYSDGVAHAHVIAKEAIASHDLIVAVGGDGTVNEIASALVGSNTVFGIIPFGSGNGLSRFLGIPMDTEKAIQNLNVWHVEAIDAATANGEWFFNMAGMGFDAHISEVFSHQKTRGFSTYIKSSFREINNYKAHTYHIDIDGVVYEREAFMLSFANSSQYGNNAHVSPHASVQDGLLDVCIIKPFPLWRFVGMGIRMFTKTADRSKYVEIIRGKHIIIKRNEPGPFHLDGEPRIAPAIVDINIVPSSLRIIAGKSFRNS